MTTTKSRLLGAAACALLGSAGPARAADAEWEIDTATLVYSETGRVSLVEPVIAARRRWNDRSFGGKLTLDALTGPSPSGATPASTPQTFTGASGNGDLYTAAPGEIPLDDAFRDTRVALAFDYSHPLGSSWTSSYGLNFSTEYDFLSVGGALRLSRDFNQRNTTLSLGAALESDSIKPVGGVPVPLTVLQRRNAPGDSDGENRAGRASTESKTVTDLMIGLTQVLDPRSLLRVNLIYSQSDGYQTDPYKIVSVVGADGEPLRYVREARPDARAKSGLYGEYLRDFSGATLKGSYRFLVDDWGIASHTVETSYRQPWGENNYLEPQLRYYQQSAADFYRVALFDGEETGVREVSADYRLGGMNTWTAGIEYGRRMRSGSDLNLRLSYYLQSPEEDAVPSRGAAGLSKFGELVPQTRALMATVGYRFKL